MFTTTFGKFILTFLISMVPVVELRGGLPYGIVSGLPYGLAVTAAVLGNMLPVPFIILFIEKVFAWLREHFPKIDSFISSLEKRAADKQETVDKYFDEIASSLFTLELSKSTAYNNSFSSIRKLNSCKSVKKKFFSKFVVLSIIFPTFSTISIFFFIGTSFLLR